MASRVAHDAENVGAGASLRCENLRAAAGSLGGSGSALPVVSSPSALTSAGLGPMAAKARGLAPQAPGSVRKVNGTAQERLWKRTPALSCATR